MGLLARYVSGLCVAALGLCAAGWLVLTPAAFGYRGVAPHGAALADRATGGGLAVVSLLTLLGWTLAWRRKLRADGALPRVSRRQARREARELRRRELDGDSVLAGGTPDPAQVLNELRALLLPLLAESPESPAEAPAPAQPGLGGEVRRHPGIPEPRSEQEPFGITAPAGIAAIESMLAGADLLMVSSSEEEAW
jgi:hypothetical protein